jgi:hypothetical protein
VHGRLALQCVDVLFADRLHPLLRQERANRLLHLIERRPLNPSLVGLIPGGDVLFGHRLRLGGDFLLDQRGPIDPLCLRRVVHQLERDDFVERGPPRLVQRLGQLGAAEVPGRLIERLVVHFPKRDGR